MFTSISLHRPDPVLKLTNRSDAEVKTELGRQLLVGLQSALEIHNL